MVDVFISYKSEDRRRIQPLVQALQADGLSVWWDEHIGAGDAWRETIERQLDSARSVLVVWSKRSVGPDGSFVRDEASRAQRRGVYVPVLIDHVEPPLGFGESQATSLRGWRGDSSDPNYQAVLAALRRITGDASAPAVPNGVKRAIVSRRAIIGGGAAVTAAGAGFAGWTLLKPTPAAAADSIAVLPFANLSGDASQQYFSDGIAEELRSALSRVAALKVVGRTSSEAVRNEDAQIAARRLGVPNVLTGSVRRSPATIRISAQLIVGATGLERWSNSYDRPPGDAIRIQTEIAESVARSLSLALGSGGRAALMIGGTKNAAAQNLVLQADELTREFTRQSFNRGIELLDQAIALDPNYGRAYGLKSIVLLILTNRHSRSAAELARGRAEAHRIALKAIEVAPDLPIGHGALAEIYRSNLQIAAASRQHERVNQLASSDPEELLSYARFLSAMGEVRKAMRLADQALSLDRLSPGPYSTRAGLLLDDRQYDAIVKSAEQLKRDSPELFNFHLALGTALMMLRRFDEARAAYSKVPAEDPIRMAAEAVLAARSGDPATATAVMEELRQLYGEAASYQFAEIQAQLGNVEAAFEELNVAWRIRDAGLLGLKVDASLDSLRADTRMGALLRAIGFPV